MRTGLTAIARGVSGIFALAGLPNGAYALVSTQTANFAQVGTVTVLGGNSTISSVISQTATRNQDFNRFDPDDGVLTGVTVKLAGANGTGSATRRQTLSGSGSGGTTGVIKTLIGTGTFGSVRIGYEAILSSTLGSATSVTGGSTSTSGSGAYSAVNSPLPVTGQLAIGTSLMSGFVVGSGNTTVTVNTNYSVGATTQRTTSGTGQFTSTTANNSATLSGSLTVSYDYLRHAQASFDDGAAQVASKTIDFGTWFNDDPTVLASQSVDIWNRNREISDPEQADLALMSSWSTGATEALGFFPPTSAPLAAGVSTRGDATFSIKGHAVGNYAAVYSLGFRDDEMGTAANPSVYGYYTPGQESNYTLTLSLTGAIKEHADASFDSASTVTSRTLDFGAATGPDPSVLHLDIFNRATAGDAVDLRFVGCTSADGDTGAFSVGICSSVDPVDIAAGSFYQTLVSFLGGAQSPAAAATYNLQFVDYFANLNGSPSSYYLTLNIAAGATAVPLPAALWLYASAVAGIACRRRRIPAITT